jgi:hypothetical protein
MMENDTKKNVLMEETTKVVQVLTPLSSIDRARLVIAAFAILGDAVPNVALGNIVRNTREGETEGGDIGELPLRARTWMNQTGISCAELQQVFHVADGKAEVIAAVPGKNNKEQTYNAYILTGVGQLLLAGSAAFSDKAARALCESSGCYDQANHSASIRDRGNEFTGTKDKGWTLTGPGLRRAAEIIKELNKSHNGI